MRTLLPDAADLPAFLDRVDFVVPARTEGRVTAHREGHCIMAALRWLAVARPALFPATLVRGEAPDFVVHPASGAAAWAFEHTDAGEEAFQRWLDESELNPVPSLSPSPNDDGWPGDSAEKAFANAIWQAVSRKAREKYWRNGPAGCVRCVLLYDQTNTAIFVSDADAASLLQEAVASAQADATVPLGVILLHGAGRTLVAGAIA